MTINFGIDLGTTNSVIARFQEGKVRVYKDRVSLKETVPSVVFFREDRVVIGSKAKERVNRDAANVFGSFKRKMGTSESYLVPATTDLVSPIDLSAQVLRYLKSLAEEPVDAAVVTIPASFDTIQSNATKAAGEAAGLKQVHLLQEPIAASLAFANRVGEEAPPEEGRWLVYDLGGGTFDVALVEIEHGEMRVVDHEGNNFLGGVDFDMLILDHLIIPALEAKGAFANLSEQMKQSDGRYNTLFHRCLHLAEAAKIELSTIEEAEIEVETEDDAGKQVDLFFTIRRADFERLIQPAIQETLGLIDQMIVRNRLDSSKITSVILVGGSTYIPYVRQNLATQLQIPVDASVDPTTAVAIGAAYYAGTQPLVVEKMSVSEPSAGSLDVKMAYPKTSQDSEAFWAAKVKGELAGLSFQIIRMDGGFDSGLRPLNDQLHMELPLVGNSYNLFKFTVYDQGGNEVSTNAETIGITHGKYNVEGQPLPQDICLEVDDPDNGSTKLDVIFPKNMVLPMRKTKLYPLNQTLRRGMAEDEIIINIVEGPAYAMPEACQTIGYVKITGVDLRMDIPQHSDLEITCKLSESRDLEITVYFSRSDQEFKRMFTPKERHTPVPELQAQVRELHKRLAAFLSRAEKEEDFEAAKSIHQHQQEMQNLLEETNSLNEKDVSDRRYQLEDRKRKLALKVDQMSQASRLQRGKKQYQEIKKWAQPIIRRFGNEYEQELFRNIENQEASFLISKNSGKIENKKEEIRDLASQIWWRTPELQMQMFQQLASNVNFAGYRDPNRARNLIQQGRQAMNQQNWPELAQVNGQLLSMLPRDVSDRISSGRSVGF